MSASERPLSFAHRFVPGAGAAARTTLLLLHGTGGDEDDLIDLGRALLPGATLLSPRGQVLESGRRRFFRRVAEGVFDEEDLARRTHELADFVAAAAGAYGLDPSRIVAAGYSNGANIATSTLLLRPATLAAAALFRPLIPFARPEPPDLSGKAVLVAGGAADPYAPVDATRRLVDLLEGAGAAVTVHRHPGGHELGEDDVAAAATWLCAWEGR